MRKCMLVLAILLLLVAPAAWADIQAITLNTYTDFTNGSWTLGFEFSPNVNIDVTALGSFFPTGATDQHGVSLWNLGGGAPLANTTVTGTGAEGFVFGAIAPLNLFAGNTYVVGANTLSDDYADIDATFTAAPEIGYLAHREVRCDGVTPCYPTGRYTDFDDFGANFAFTAAVPEPGSIVLVGTLLGLGLLARKRR